MSAYVVSDEVIQRALTLWAYPEQYTARPALEYVHSLGREMLALNNKAVYDRYSHHTKCADMLTEPEEINNFKFHHNMATRLQAYRALDCLLYQCSEGDCPETAIYKTMEKMLHNTAAELVCGLPEYEAASGYAI